jgi:pimeloyl-ACP methyl ester carboxylesterase
LPDEAIFTLEIEIASPALAAGASVAALIAMTYERRLCKHPVQTFEVWKTSEVFRYEATQSRYPARRLLRRPGLPDLPGQDRRYARLHDHRRLATTNPCGNVQYHFLTILLIGYKISELEVEMTANNPFPNEKPPVIFVPGGIMPAELAYGPLLGVIGDQIRPYPKELEVYATDQPPANYGLEVEVEGIRRVADAAGLERFHLVGYSAGGASSLAFTAKYPERLNSLALIEPALIGDHVPEDAHDWADMERLIMLPPADRMAAFLHWQMLPGVQPPALPIPAGPAPAWMEKRPAGLEAFIRAFDAYKLDQERFRLLDGPVYYAFGSLSTRLYARAAKRLLKLFPDFQVEEYAGRSHLDPPHRAEAERFGRALTALWKRAEEVSTAGKQRY